MKNVKNKVFFRVLTLKVSFALIFTVKFVISKSKYVGIRSFKTIRGISHSEAHLRFIINDFEYPRIPSFIKIK